MDNLIKDNDKKQKNGLTRGHFKLKPINSSYWRELFLIMRVAEFPNTPEWFEEAEIMISDLPYILGVFKGTKLIGGIWIGIRDEPFLDVVIHPDYHGKWATKEKCAKAVKMLMEINDVDVVYSETSNSRAAGILYKLGFRRVLTIDDGSNKTTTDYVVDAVTIERVLNG